MLGSWILLHMHPVCAQNNSLISDTDFGYRCHMTVTIILKTQIIYLRVTMSQNLNSEVNLKFVNSLNECACSIKALCKFNI